MFRSFSTTVATPSKWRAPRWSPSRPAGGPGDLHRRGEARGIDLRRPGREEQVHAGGARDRGVGVLVARVRGEVGGLVELGRVHEERHDDDVGLRPRAAQELGVALVQRAHRRHEARSIGRRAGAGERLAELGDGADGPHAVTRDRGPRAAPWRPRARRTPRGGRASALRPRRAGARRSRGRRGRSGRSARARRPRCAQASTAARTSGTSASRPAPVVSSRRSAPSSSVVRRFAAIDAAAW